MPAFDFADRTRISSILARLFESDPVTSSLVTEKPPGRTVPVLTEADGKALDSIYLSGDFTIDKSAGMYAGVTRIRPRS